LSVVRFGRREEDLTAEILTEALAVRYPGVRVAAVEVLATKRCGEGIASTADRMVLELTYAEGSAGDLPERLVLKTMLVTPHAPSEMYETEVRFYNELRPSLSLETPRCYAASFDPATGQFGLLLEDLSERGARFPNATVAVSVDEVGALLDQLASLHAQFWQSSRFATDLAWVATPNSGGMSGIFERHGLAIISDQVRRHPFKQELIAPLGLSIDELWVALALAERSLEFAPVTLLHGDAHIANTYLLADGTGGLLDWQLQVRGCWAHDVAYLISTALDPDVRRAEGRVLLGHYLDGLASRGVHDAPSRDEAWEWCRRAALWGLVIGWLITPPENYGPEITAQNTMRMVAAIEDFDTLSAITERPPH
jgi:Phosphotransferase enzyme family